MRGGVFFLPLVPEHPHPHSCHLACPSHLCERRLCSEHYQRTVDLGLKNAWGLGETEWKDFSYLSCYSYKAWLKREREGPSREGRTRDGEQKWISSSPTPTDPPSPRQPGSLFKQKSFCPHDSLTVHIHALYLNFPFFRKSKSGCFRAFEG